MKDLEARLSDMLDFYSDKASTHTTILVAVIISLFTIPALTAKADSARVWILFLLLWLIGLWTLYNFSYFSEHAERILWYLVTTESEHEKYKIEICANRSLQKQVAKIVKTRWNKNPLRYLFVVSKTSRLDFKLELRKKDFSKIDCMTYRLSHFFPFFYAFLGFCMSFVFFPILSAICFGVILDIFAIDLIILYWQIQKITRSCKAQGYLKKVEGKTHNN